MGHEAADQGEAPEEKILAALERAGRALRGLLWEAVQPLGLSPIQGQILLYLRDHRQETCRVSYLAREFGLTQATVSDAVSALVSKGLIRKDAAASDRRVSPLRLTAAGEEMADRLAGWGDRAREALAAFTAPEREGALLFLLRLIEGWQRSGIVSVARMCLTCRFFRQGGGPPGGEPYFCALLEQPLAPAALRVDCPDYEPAPA